MIIASKTCPIYHPTEKHSVLLLYLRTLSRILARYNNSHAEEYRYSYRIEGDITDKDLKGILLEIKNQPGNIKTLTDFIMAEDNPRIMAANRDVDTNVKVGLMAGAIVLVLITYVISVFVVHSIDQESAMIGALCPLASNKSS